MNRLELIEYNRFSTERLSYRFFISSKLKKIAFFTGYGKCFTISMTFDRAGQQQT